MNDIKIKRNRERKRSGERRNREYRRTPPYHTWRRSTHFQLRKMSAKYGYDYETYDDSKIMKQLREEFKDKAMKYIGGFEHATKSQSRFDKMKKKKELNFEIKKNPVLVALEKMFNLRKKIQLSQAFQNLKQ